MQNNKQKLNLVMSNSNLVEQIVENPKATVGVITGLGAVADRLLIDPYSKCGWPMTIFSFVFSITLVNGIVAASVLIDWVDLGGHLLDILMKMVGLVSSVIACIALYKKNFRIKRRKKVSDARKKHREEIGQNN